MKNRRRADEGVHVISVREVGILAGSAHAGQTDKTGVPYTEHVRAVARRARPVR